MLGLLKHVVHVDFAAAHETDYNKIATNTGGRLPVHQKQLEGNLSR
jgi:hypothetical protein